MPEPPPIPPPPSGEVPEPPPPSEALPPPGWGILDALVVFTAAFVVGVILALPFTRLPCGPQAVGIQAILELSLLASVVFWVRYVRHSPTRALGAPRRPWGDSGIGLAAGVGLVIVTGLWVTVVVQAWRLVFGFDPTPPDQVADCIRGAAVAVNGFVIVVLAPLGEEFFFRGFLYRALRRRFAVVASVAISALAFSTIHFSPFLILALLPVGAGLALLFELRQSLLPPLVAHATFNLIGFLVLIS